MYKEDFVTYEQAICLKELGFDWKCGYYYDNNGNLISSFESFEDEVFFEEVCIINIESLMGNFNIQDDSYSAPTLSQVQKWLLKVKGIYVSAVYDSIITKKWISSVDDIKNDKSNSLSEVFQSPEEALSASITEYLKNND